MVVTDTDRSRPELDKNYLKSKTVGQESTNSQEERYSQTADD
jgi:hypothetical protein